jgi:preprotein translocase subunit SecA
LRSFLCYDPSELIQRPFHYAIVDEADSILIDEGRIPLVIAGERPLEVNKLETLAELVKTFSPGLDYSIDEERRNVNLSEQGIIQAETRLRCGNLYTAKNTALLALLNNALHAEVLLKRDVDYIIQKGRVELVDEFTRRVVENRHWPDGLQEAVEAKEGLNHSESGKILGSITMQHFLNCYPKIAGMTGTAIAAADEFKEFYNLDVVVIPPNRPSIRVDEADKVFTHRAAKFSALLQDITLIHGTGRPILVGTANIQESEQLAKMLDQAGLPYQLLNAKNDEHEAKIIAQAGTPGAITISTNMAGRGTDIRLGGVDEQESELVKALGGLYVIGVNHFESTRIDNQLRGRTGRQGNPGSSRFYISLEDELIVRYGIRELTPERYRSLKQEQPINDPIVSCQIHDAQKTIEAQNFEIHKKLWKYSWIVEKQRRIIHRWRQAVLLDQERPCLFQTALPERYLQLSLKYGENILQKAEKLVTLYQIDSFWADFLEQVAEVREGIHLVALSGRIPLNEFNKATMELYLKLKPGIEQAIVRTLNTIEITENGFDSEKASLKTPSATWTYMISDTLFSSKLQIALTPLVKKLLKKECPDM